MNLHGYENLDYLLGPRGRVRAIGPEDGPERPPRTGTARYASEHGSVRYVRYEEGVPVAALQLVTRDGRTAIAANVFTAPTHRRRRLAARLLKRARMDFEQIRFSDDRSDAGRAWVDAVEARPAKRKQAAPSSLEAILRMSYQARRHVPGAREVLHDALLERYPRYVDLLARTESRVARVKETHVLVFSPRLATRLERSEQELRARGFSTAYAVTPPLFTAVPESELLRVIREGEGWLVITHHVRPKTRRRR